MTRNKTISDEQVLDRLLHLVLETGPDGLTFRLSAKACGLSPATLVQRYGSRQQLVEAVLLRAWDRLQADTEAADSKMALTPDGAVELLMHLMPKEAAERNATQGLLLLKEDISNPNLRARGAVWGNTLARALGRRLSNGPHSERLGWQMAAVWQGAHTWWAFTRQDDPDIMIQRMLREWMGLALAAQDDRGGRSVASANGLDHPDHNVRECQIP